jgi:arginine/lysine/ornithine decarboxylase
MPGHKGIPIQGNPISSLFPLDITEIRGADFLLSAKGIIRESQENAAKLFGTLRTVYSTEGSTLCVKTMLAMVCEEKGGFCGKVIATRKAHRSFSDAALLLGLKVIWADTYEDIEKALTDPAVKCVYITSPDYFGRFEDIRTIADLTHTYGRILIVDNAHGAYLKFISKNSFHPADLGADLVCDSAHKTLPVLTGGAYLHICNPRFIENYKNVMKVFASTSPSYLVLASLDYANFYLSQESVKSRMNEVALEIKNIKEKYGIKTPEPYKIAVKTSSNAEALCDRYSIEPEYVSDDVLLFMFSGANTDEDLNAAENVLKNAKFRRDLTDDDKKNTLSGLGYTGNSN